MANTKPIRRSHLISPFGIGALVDFRNGEVLMTAGLDEWPLARDKCPFDWLVREERLEARLGVSHFRLPPEYREHGQGVEHPEKHIPFVRFPRWHYCPRSGAMERLRLNEGRKQCECHTCRDFPKKKRPYLVQSPYVAVCEKGHIEDFPFMRWVHRDKAQDYVTCRLSWPTGHLYSGRFVSNIRCTCGQEASLKDICNFSSDSGGALSWIGYKCRGKMPWFGEKNEECGEHLRVVQRDSSNVYFPKTVSSIYIPFQRNIMTAEKINRLLERQNFWSELTRDLDDGKYINKSICGILARANSVDPEELRDAAQRKLDGVAEPAATRRYSEEELRRQEYEILRNGKSEGTTELRIESRDPAEGGSPLSDFLDGICLVRKLRETRVFTGFSRLHPPEETDSALLPISEDELSWMPATRHYGEGIFLEFNKRKLDTWAERPDVVERVKSMLTSIKDHDRPNAKPKFILLHTFAHVLIRQLSYDCGYGSASLRERVYCEEENLGKPMQGVLIYTASGDSEGSLGGLVRRGEPSLLSSTISKAMIEASWCSSDPVCIESEHQKGYAANLAACHSCVLLPETSCEKGNRLLDRGLLTGKPDNPEIGFFGSLLEN